MKKLISGRRCEGETRGVNSHSDVDDSSTDTPLWQAKNGEHDFMTGFSVS